MAAITASTAATVSSGRGGGRGTGGGCGRGAPRCGAGSRGERLASPLMLGLGFGGADAAAPPPPAVALGWVPLVLGSAADDEEDDALEGACGFCAAGAAGGAIGLGLGFEVAVCMTEISRVLPELDRIGFRFGEEEEFFFWGGWMGGRLLADAERRGLAGGAQCHRPVPMSKRDMADLPIANSQSAHSINPISFLVAKYVESNGGNEKF